MGEYEQKRYYNTAEVAKMLGILKASVRRKAHDAGIGTMLNERAMLFTDEDVEKLKALVDGRGKWQKDGGRKRYLEEKKQGTWSAKG